MISKKQQAKDFIANLAEGYIEDKWLDLKEPINTLFELIVPSSGMASTVAGEIVRATMRILYRYYNDGDRYNAEDCINSYNYLCYISDEYCTDSESCIRGTLENSDNDPADCYADYFQDFCYTVLCLLRDNPELLDMENEIDSRNYEPNRGWW